jgi:PQQ-dependent catabolism-associated CXXCW motif protein
MSAGSSRFPGRALGAPVIAMLALAVAGSSVRAQAPSTGVEESGPPGRRTVQAPSLASQRAADALDQLEDWERQDMGVAPERGLHTGAMHSPTPTEIPGGQLITTKGVLQLLQNGRGSGAIILDVLGSPKRLPDAIFAAEASHAGSFSDSVQRQLENLLEQATHGNHDVPLVLYCQGPHCWNSYNASLRAVSLGYTNVLWYRGGLEAWQRAGLPLAAAR